MGQGIDVDGGVPVISRTMGEFPLILNRGDGRSEKAELAAAVLRRSFFQVGPELRQQTQQALGVDVPWWPKAKHAVEALGFAASRIIKEAEAAGGTVDSFLAGIRREIEKLSIGKPKDPRGPEKDIDGVLKTREARCAELAYLFYSLALSVGLDAYPIEVIANASRQSHAAIAVRDGDRTLYFDPANPNTIADSPPWIVHRIGDAPLLLGIYEYNRQFDGSIAFQDEIAIMTTMSEITPGSPLLFYGVAKAYLMAGDRPAAEEALCRAMSIWPLIPGACTTRDAILSLPGKEAPRRCEAFSSCDE